jgi:ABC-type lipoprotein release transport system permease subunit
MHESLLIAIVFTIIGVILGGGWMMVKIAYLERKITSLIVENNAAELILVDIAEYFVEKPNNSQNELVIMADIKKFLELKSS